MNIPNGYANIQWTFLTSRGQDALTACGIQLAIDPDPDAILEGAKAAFEDNLSTYIQDGFHGNLIRLQLGTLTPGEYLVYELAPWEGGTSATSGLPPNVSTLVKKITGRGGRKGRGRFFLPPMGEAGVDAFGEMSDSQFNALATACAAFRTDLRDIPDVLDLVLLHTDPTEDPDVITSLVPSRMVATQRRRLRN